MRSFAGLFFMSMITLLWLAAPNSSTSASPTQGAIAASFSPSETMAPTPAPTAGPDGYRLKAWTEQDAITAISEGEKLLADADHPDGFYEQAAARLYLTTILQEAFLRFPATQSQDRLLWEFIREEVNREYGYGPGVAAERLLRALEKALNSGQVHLPDLESWLDERGFAVASRTSAYGFFGDGQAGLVLQIENPRLASRSDLVVIVEGSRPGEYRLTSIKPFWRSFDLYEELVELSVKDHNGNGRPEIAAVTSQFGHASCRIRLDLYEWQGERADGHFENIAEDPAGFWEGIWGDYYYRDCVGIWEFGTPDSKGAQPLFQTLSRHNSAGEPCWDYDFRERYEWDGQKYTWVSGDVVPPYPGQPAKCFADWAVAAADDALYDQAIPIAVSTLANWPAELDKVWGPSAKDLFRFKLGTWYAFAGKYDSAVATLLDVRDHPADWEHSMVSRMADVFLSRYRVLNHADDACDAVVKFVDADFREITVDQREFVATEITIPRWGLAEPYWQWLSNPGFYDLCRRGWRKGLPSPVEVQVPTPQPTPTPGVTPTPSPWELEARVTDRMEAIEGALFKDGDARQAALLARRLVAERIPAEQYKGSKEVEPHLLYLLALSSELAGDEPGAVTVYRQLLQEHPKSHYAAMARRKLEPVAP